VAADVPTSPLASDPPRAIPSANPSPELIFSKDWSQPRKAACDIYRMEPYLGQIRVGSLD
jgi:hypothetical protein